jgi:hypothetical protein
MPEAMMLRGRLEWLRGRRSLAEKWWQRSRALAEETGVPYELARTFFEIGLRTRNREQLESAEKLFLEMEAQWDLARVREAESGSTAS